MDDQLSARECEEAILDFVDCIKIPTVSGLGPINGSYNDMATWLMNQMKSIVGIVDIKIVEDSLDGHPLVVGSIIGSIIGRKPELPQLLLNSHYDVVPVIEENWTVPPFDGLRRDGRIYGRGTQDMKCVVVSYLHAIKKLIKSEF